DLIRNSGESLLTIINDILDVSKIESGRIDIESHPYALRKCVGDAIELLGPAAAEKGLRIELLFDPLLPATVDGDDTRLGQVLVNLIGNAIKFTAHGKV